MKVIVPACGAFDRNIRDFVRYGRMTEQDALDPLTMASFLHRRLDTAARPPRLV